MPKKGLKRRRRRAEFFLVVGSSAFVVALGRDDESRSRRNLFGCLTDEVSILLT